MSVVFQIAGKARPDRAAEVRQVVAENGRLLRRQAGFERAKLLVNYATLQVQLLLYWQSYEQGLAFHQADHARLAARLQPVMDEQGTLITSVIESEIAV